MNAYTLPILPYAYNALEPYIDTQTMEIHHGKHHAAYVSKFNTALEKHPELYDLPLETLLANLASVPADIRNDVRNNGGGHYNHSLFWNLLARDAVGHPVGELSLALTAKYGSVDTFQKDFETAATQRFGSGWAWLSMNALGDLVVHSTPNQDSPIMEGLVPIIGLDVWEHAYYLKYQNRRPDYINAFWNVLNWKQADLNYKNSLETIRRCFTPGAVKKVS